MATEPAPIELPTVDVVADRVKPQFAGRRDHDAEYENNPAKPQFGPEKLGPRLPDDTVTLEVAGQKFIGWKDVRIVRGMEVFPSSFALRVTERLPDSPKLFVISPGQIFRLYFGADLVMSGYIDDYRASVSAKGHEVLVTGRSGTADLIDADAGVTQGQEANATMTFSAPTLLALATDLCTPFGISVTAPDGEGQPLVSIGDGIPQFTMALGQKVYDVLEPLARVRQRILMDGTDGNLVIAKAGVTKAASGFTMPGSAERAEVAFSKQNRFTVYLPALSNFDTAFQVSQTMQVSSANFLKPIHDEAAFKDQPRLDGKARYRPRFVISEQPGFGLVLAEKRAEWQKARDYGRSQAVTVVVPTWRDSAGVLWTPNTLAEVNIPALKLEKLTWIISEVSYLRGFGGGTRAVVTLMPPEAFAPEPVFYTPYDPQITQALGETLSRRSNGGEGPSGGGGQG